MTQRDADDDFLAVTPDPDRIEGAETTAGGVPDENDPNALPENPLTSLEDENGTRDWRNSDGGDGQDDGPDELGRFNPAFDPMSNDNR